MLSPIQLTPGMDQNSLASALNLNFQQLEAENRTKVVKDENGNDRVIIGRYANGEYGIKVSKPGSNVNEAEADDLYFNSNQNVFKIVKSGSVTNYSYSVLGGSSGQWTNWNAGGPIAVDHDLGYVPSVIAFVNYSGQYVLLPTTFQSIVGNSGTGAAFERVFINVDSTKLYIGSSTLVNGIVTTPYSGGGQDIKYFLLQESAA